MGRSAQVFFAPTHPRLGPAGTGMNTDVRDEKG